MKIYVDIVDRLFIFVNFMVANRILLSICISIVNVHWINIWTYVPFALLVGYGVGNLSGRETNRLVYFLTKFVIVLHEKIDYFFVIRTIVHFCICTCPLHLFSHL
jgi:hypothetical protein